MICPHCAKEIVTPVVNDVVPNINGCAAQPAFTPLNLAACDASAPIVFTNLNFNSAACVPCQPTVTGTFVLIP